MFLSKESLCKFVQAFESKVTYSSNIRLLADYDMSNITCDNSIILYSSVQFQRNYIMCLYIIWFGVFLCEVVVSTSQVLDVRWTEVTVVSVLSASNSQLKLNKCTLFSRNIGGSALQRISGVTLVVTLSNRKPNLFS